MKGKRIIVSPHARFEMHRRGIALSEMIATIRHPDQVVRSEKGREIRQSLLGARRRMLLRVVVKETGSAYYVVTAYKSSKITKYWQPS